MPQEFIIFIDSIEGVRQVDIKPFDAIKGVSVIMAEGVIKGYQFDLGNDANWTEETAIGYIQKHKSNEILQSQLSGGMNIIEKVTQDYLTEATLSELKKIDPDPFFTEIKVNYGLGSNKQFFDKAFFQKAGAKFEGKPFFLNHSDLTEFGKGNPIGSVIKFLGAEEDGARFATYISAAEGTLRQKIKESKALGNLGFVKKVSIEGIPSETDYSKDDKTGIKYFSDLKYPTGIAIVNLEGLQGSQII